MEPFTCNVYYPTLPHRRPSNKATTQRDDTRTTTPIQTRHQRISPIPHTRTRTNDPATTDTTHSASHQHPAGTPAPHCHCSPPHCRCSPPHDKDNPPRQPHATSGPRTSQASSGGRPQLVVLQVQSTQRRVALECLGQLRARIILQRRPRHVQAQQRGVVTHRLGDRSHRNGVQPQTHLWRRRVGANLAETAGRAGVRRVQHNVESRVGVARLQSQQVPRALQQVPHAAPSNHSTACAVVLPHAQGLSSCSPGSSSPSHGGRTALPRLPRPAAAPGSAAF